MEDTNKPKPEQGLGSASTMISYIKPNKTGEQSRPTTPAPPKAAPLPNAEVDEMGMWGVSAARGANGSNGIRVGAPKPKKETRFELPQSSGRPLSHVRNF